VLETNVSNKLPYLTQIPMSSLCCKGEDKINYDDTTHFEGRWEMHKKFWSENLTEEDHMKT